MLSRTKRGNGLLLLAVLLVLAVLVLSTAGNAQVAPSSSGFGTTSLGNASSAFGGGTSGFGSSTFGSSGGAAGLSGGASGLSGGTGGLNGSYQLNQGVRWFSGQVPMTGGTAGQGGYGGGGLYGGTSGTSSNALSRFYLNPQAPGAPNASGTTNFYAPIYGGATGNQGGTGFSYSGGNFGSPGFGNNFNYPSNSNQTGTGTGYRRSSAYAVGTGLSYGPAGSSVIATEVQQVLARSTALNPNRDIRVGVDGPAVVLRGTVDNEQDRRLAEMLVRLSPGVYEIRNELQVSQGTPRPRRGP